MLNKRFKPAKCKTSLKLATSRIKLMRNKKGIQINQMKKELAQLLDSGQDRTARIRVEHVIREEKMVSAYDLIEIYCELIVARLQIIESQKTCPIDLKEAIASVIFAAPRCSDIPELLDVRKQFTTKYGKEFVVAAIELRPDCGVSRMLVEKLSATAPDVPTKMKVLSGVAKEHNIKWDPTSFEEKESKPSDDLLNGPANIKNSSMINVDPPKLQTLSFENVHAREETPNVPVGFSQQNRRYTLGTPNITDGSYKSFGSTTHEDMRSSGMVSETMNMRHSFNRNEYNASSGRENWNMEFKDATSAAHAAAESAERASMAARAAAHLSSQGKITRQYSNQSHESRIRKQPSISSSHSHSTPISHDLGQTPGGKRTGVGNPSDENVFRGSRKASSYGDDHKDDETDTDDDGPRFDTGFEYNEDEVKTFFPSPGRESVPPFEENRIELNDLIGRGSIKRLQSRGSKNDGSESRSPENNQSDDSDSGNELKFKNLIGDHREKGGLKYPPAMKTNPTSYRSSFNSRTSRSNTGKLSGSLSSSESGSDDYGGKFPVGSFKTRSKFAPPDAFFNGDGSDSDEERAPAVSKPTSSGQVHLGSWQSRRTKGYVEPLETRSHMVQSKQEVVETISEPVVEISEPPLAPTKKVAEAKTKPSNLGLDGLVKADSFKKPSHVHPKLPDYDSLAARFQSLRTNRQ